MGPSVSGLFQGLPHYGPGEKVIDNAYYGQIKAFFLWQQTVGSYHKELMILKFRVIGLLKANPTKLTVTLLSNIYQENLAIFF